jgi:hypothetical protein
VVGKRSLSPSSNTKRIADSVPTPDCSRNAKKMGGQPPQVPDPEHAQPVPTAQRNFTDPESRIMKDGATKGFEQAYNAQGTVDSTAHRSSWRPR